MEVTITNLPAMKLAGITHIGEFEKTQEIYARLLQWATGKGLLHQGDLKMVTIYHDNPRITAISKVRWSACIITNEDITPDGEVRAIGIQPGQYAAGHFTIAPYLIPQAWEQLSVWVKEHGYSFRDRDYFELYSNVTPGAAEMNVTIYIPVE